MKFFSILGLAALPALASAWLFEPSAMSVDRHHSLSDKHRAKKIEGLCDTVDQEAGYIDIGDGKNIFYWYFDSRNDPSNDPVMIWFTGGPGCSSAVALFHENGPCHIQEDNKTTKPNPYSWTNKANVLWIDQPAGVGFSYGPEDDRNENDVADDMITFLTVFFESYPEIKHRQFFIFGESYGGHYVPAVAARVQIWNKNAKSEDEKINLVGIGIGNGLTDPLHQYPEYPEYAYKNHVKPLVSKDEYESMKGSVSTCSAFIKRCQGGSSVSCFLAYTYCNMELMQPPMKKGINQYDVREQCEVKPLCYDFSDVETFLNSDDVQKELGVDQSWTSCNFDINRNFMFDFMREFEKMVADSLADGVRVLIYAGDCDWICNWMGNLAWVKVLDWEHKEEWNKSEFEKWSVGGKPAGEKISSNNLTFLRVYEAGHMVPMNQPEAALQMFNEFLDGDL
eukprot:Clim_evm49s210 gene=Clim_evmTU49s210